MPKLSEIQAYEKHVPVEIGNVTLDVAFHPAKFTGKLQRDLSVKAKAVKQKIEAGEEPTPEETEGTAALLVELLSSWDLTDDKGKPCPITAKFLVDELGYYGMNRISTAVLEALNPNA